MNKPDEEYIRTDPFCGEESELTCRTISIRTAKKYHACFTLDGIQDHAIKPGDRYRYERARVDGDFWAEYKICLNCMNKYIDSGHE